MAVASVYSLSPIRLGTTVLPVERYSFSHGIIEDTHSHSGNENPTLVRVPGAVPRLTITMPFLAAHTAIGLGLTEFTACDMYLAKFANSIRSASAVHRKFALTTNCVACAQITGWTVSVDGTVMAVIDIVLRSSNGRVYPLTATDNNALPALASQPVMHTLGPVTVNGTVITGLTATAANLQPNLDVRRSDGDDYTRTVARIGGAPRLSLDHADPIGALTAITDQGANITSNVIAYFRRYNPTTGVVDSAGGNDISVTIGAGRIHPMDVEVAHGEVATMGLEVIGLAGAALPFVIATNATAPADAP